MPDAAARWVCAVTGAALTGVTAFAGATSSFVAALDFSGGARLVLRLHTKDRWLAREPDLATREAHTLRALASHGIAAPTLVAVDEAGEFCGRPAPSGPLAFIHRDYHPGNVLVDDGVVSGIIDCLDMFCDDAPTDAPEFDGLRAAFFAMARPR